MSDQFQFSEEDSRRLIVAITDFLRDQLNIREDLLPEDRDCLEIAIQCLEMAYELNPNGYVQLRFSRPLLDIFTQVTNPVPVKDRIRADAHKDEGNAHMISNRYQSAEAEYTAAIELDKWNSIYYCNRAGARIEQQNYFEAIADCRQALMLNPDYAKAYGRMGQAYALLNRPREASRCFRQALQLDPRNERYRNNLLVAENQSNRANVMGLFSGVLSSILGAGPPTVPRSSSTGMAPSFMIITERPNLPGGAFQRNAQPSQTEATSTERQQQQAPIAASTERQQQQAPITTSTERNVPAFIFSNSFGGTNTNSTRSSAVQEDPAEDSEDDVEVDMEIILRVPESYSGAGLFPDVVPTSCPWQDDYDFTARDTKPGKINDTTTVQEKHESTHKDIHSNGDDVPSGIKRGQPDVEKDAESGKTSSLENNKRIETDAPKADEDSFKQIPSHTPVGSTGIQNGERIATDTPKAQDTILEHIPSHTPDGSVGIQNKHPETEKIAESDKLSAQENKKKIADDGPKVEDTDFKPSYKADELPFVVRWPTNDEWNKIKENEGMSAVSSPPIIESPSAEKKTADNSGLSKEGQTPVPKKTISSENELFDTILSQLSSNVVQSEEGSEDLDEESKVSDKKESQDGKPDDSN